MELVAPSGTVYQAGTLSANPVGMRAGLATLQKIERVNAYAVLEEKTGSFCDQLNGEMGKRGFPFQLTRTASIFWLHARTNDVIRRIDQIPPEHSAAFAKVFHGALSRGVYLAPSGFEVGFMSLAHTDELLERARGAILAAVEFREDSLSQREKE
jgi:glutamate-1-semialdehyde 2,1-aminomutase